MNVDLANVTYLLSMSGRLVRRLLKWGGQYHETPEVL